MLLVAGAVAALAACPLRGAAAQVGEVLVLMMDVSGSIGPADFEMQRDGYRDAFMDPGVQAAIAGVPGGIAVTLVQWGSTQTQSVGWRLLTGAPDAMAFAGLVGAMPRAERLASTGTAAALDFAAALLATGPFTSARSVIDVSSDGVDNLSTGCGELVSVCAPLQNARNRFLSDATHAINALWIAQEGAYSAEFLLAYGSTNLVGGPDAFQWAVSGSGAFGEAIARKLQVEISAAPDPVTVPEPPTLALLGAGLVTTLSLRRRVRA